MTITYTEMPRFSIGTLVATPAAQETFPDDILEECLNRHANCDWGDLCDEDRQSNEEAVFLESRLLSSYELPDGRKLWIITEADRSATTMLLPSDY